MPQISIIIPVFDEEESLPELQAWIDRVMVANQLAYEAIYIDDGSRDGSWKVIQQLSAKNCNVKAVKFLRNYGKSAALNIGFSKAQGDVVVTMDADLQDSPEEVPALYRMITEQGYDLVSGWKRKRHDPLSKTVPSRLFNGVTRVISGIKLHDFNCGLKAYANKVVKNIEIYGEMHRYIPLIAKWNGFGKIAEKEVVHSPRKYGSTKFGLERFINGFLDLISVSFVNRYKKKPMHFFGTMGSLSFMSGFAITLWLIYEKISGLSKGIKVREITDQPLFFLALVALIVGVQLFLTGFMAEMMTSNNAHKSDYTIAEEINSEE
ncbi:glycosyltransferase family 2 protein [Cyclobacterium marinum]|uniref:Glycosyl transferase family 2 n=1 Tax=Cyclobacterium marinum (strain ATCC 25205 / DSM 745 / LMG 13164 / NCIMB 1802) TaxID=880070 RepID=G0J649_CYCMS|nr:glycosyltransferase family 2 protein [Cyclobacterium marinum]AEL26801.1 glycosyl transferase family 2 [Cyclobacterium marinum DSM 745]MBI0400148.1 glycosyltransferase family 2 protein [Cyclobacterium marinum]MBR9774247.1 glycosyltransferase family 2 protein [Cytophagales bacterium]|tara:strand:+ start:45020 stop:45982 length:963 start_codon:yes stop_codon:yes gene_type:complete